MLTAIDQVANQNHLQMIKAAIPYLDTRRQRMVSVCVKLLELENVLSFYRQTEKSSVEACSLNQGSGGAMDILNDIRNYCDKGEQDLIDQCISMLNTLELYTTLAQQTDVP